MFFFNFCTYLTFASSLAIRDESLCAMRASLSVHTVRAGVFARAAAILRVFVLPEIRIRNNFVQHRHVKYHIVTLLRRFTLKFEQTVLENN